MKKVFKSKAHAAGYIITRILIYAVLVFGALLMLLPYFWMLMSSFKSPAEIIELVTLKNIFPDKLLFSNYSGIMNLVPFMKGVGNTMIVEVSVIVVGTFVSSLAAFSFAKLKLPGKTFWLLLLMSGMMVPYAALMMPQYRVFKDVFHWTNTLLPLIVPGFFGNVSMIFFLTQYMKGIPTAFFEAAKIDGAGYFTQFIRIMFPLVKTAISAQVIFWFIGIWNDYFAPSIYLRSWDVMTLQPMLSRVNSENASKYLPYVFAGSVLSSIPMIAIYIGFQKYFIESLAISGVKG